MFAVANYNVLSGAIGQVVNSTCDGQSSNFNIIIFIWCRLFFASITIFPASESVHYLAENALKTPRIFAGFCSFITRATCHVI